MQAKVVRYRARWVFPVVAPPIDGGVVTIADGAIVDVGPPSDEASTIDLGDVALIPGLVNAHAHLDLSDLRAPIPAAALPFAEWIRRVIAHRQTPRPPARQIVEQGWREAAHFGTALVVDFVQQDWALETPSEMTNEADGDRDFSPTPRPSTAMIALRELIGPTPQRSAEAIAAAAAYLADCSAEQHRGLALHAPYTVHPRLLGAAVELSVAHGATLAMHLAESADEIELLRSGGGPLRELLEERGAWCDELTDCSLLNAVAGAARSGRKSLRSVKPLDYLRRLADAPRALVVHGNYLDHEEIAFLAARRDRMSVVYCPRTHSHFQHPPHPLPKLLAAGARVALGTDSRASSPNLDLWAEMRCIAARHPQIELATVLRLGTLAGAQALGVQRYYGALAPGRRAALACVAIPPGVASGLPHDPHAALFQADHAFPLMDNARRPWVARGGQVPEAGPSRSQDD